jgi:hypothetical protein
MVGGEAHGETGELLFTLGVGPKRKAPSSPPGLVGARAGNSDPLISGRRHAPLSTALVIGRC